MIMIPEPGESLADFPSLPATTADGGKPVAPHTHF